jgi:hypothetical protein
MLGIQETVLGQEKPNFDTTAICHSSEGADLYRMDRDVFVGLLGKQ